MDSLTPPHHPPSRPWQSIGALVLAGIVIAVAFVSLLLLAASGFIFDPDDDPPEFYLALATEHKRDMLFALLLPAVSLVLAGLSWFSSARAGARVVGAMWAGGISVLLALAMIFVGVGNINGALYFADLFGG